MKITITQTKKVMPEEPRTITVEFDTLKYCPNDNWKSYVEGVINSLDRILNPQEYLDKKNNN